MADKGDGKSCGRELGSDVVEQDKDWSLKGEAGSEVA